MNRSELHDEFPSRPWGKVEGRQHCRHDDQPRARPAPQRGAVGDDDEAHRPRRQRIMRDDRGIERDAASRHDPSQGRRPSGWRRIGDGRCGLQGRRHGCRAGEGRHARGNALGDARRTSGRPLFPRAPEERHHFEGDPRGDAGHEDVADIGLQAGPQGAADFDQQGKRDGERHGQPSCARPRAAPQPHHDADGGEGHGVDDQAFAGLGLGHDVVVPERHQHAPVKRGKRCVDRQPVPRQEGIDEQYGQNVGHHQDRHGARQRGAQAREVLALQPARERRAEGYADRAIDDRHQIRRRRHDQRRRGADRRHHHQAGKRDAQQRPSLAAHGQQHAQRHGGNGIGQHQNDPEAERASRAGQGKQQRRHDGQTVVQIAGAEHEIERKEKEQEEPHDVDAENRRQGTTAAAQEILRNPEQPPVEEPEERYAQDRAKPLGKDVVEGDGARRKIKLRKFDREHEGDAAQKGRSGAEPPQSRSASRPERARHRESERCQEQEIGHPIRPLIGAVHDVGRL